MRSKGLIVFFALAVVGCDSGLPVAAAGASQDCVRIVSAMERLACFDAQAGTPPILHEPQAEENVVATAPEPAPEPEIIALMRRAEAGRIQGQGGFRLLQEADAMPGQTRVVVSAPALGAVTSQVHLVISCLSNISRLQLVADSPIAADRMNIRLLLDGRPLGDARPWQVLDDGQVVDAGRGLVAIDQLRQLAQAGSQLRIESDSAQVDGLKFEASDLHRLITQQRKACHW